MRNLDIAFFVGVLSLILYAVWASQVFFHSPKPLEVVAADISEIGPPPQFDHVELVFRRDGVIPSGTAFAITFRGHWLTAKSNLDNCAFPAIDIAPGYYLPLNSVGISQRENVALLQSEPIADGVRLAEPDTLSSNMLSFLIGYPQGRAGEVAVRMLTPAYRALSKPSKGLLPVISWAEAGRTLGLKGDLRGLNGAPVISAGGEVVGMVIGHARRRGRFYATGLAGIDAFLAEVVVPARGEPIPPIALDNYGPAADSIRRTYQVAQLVCLPS